MKPKQPDEFDEFDKVMDGLLSVPYSELQSKLEAEKRAKAQLKEKGKRDTSTSPASPASSSRKK